jgi:hypothetical protein
MKKLWIILALLIAFEAGRMFEAVIVESRSAEAADRVMVEVDQLHWDLADIARAIRESR